MENLKGQLRNGIIKFEYEGKVLELGHSLDLPYQEREDRKDIIYLHKTSWPNDS